MPNSKSTQDSAPTAHQKPANLKDSPDVESANWYHGFMPRDEINHLLRVDGDFCLRQTEVKKGGGFQLILSVRKGESARHFRIYRDTRNGQFTVNAAGKHFDTVTQLVQYYHKSGEEINEKTHAKCKTPIERQTWELHGDQIHIGEKLGHGEYGEVHRGELRIGSSILPIAAKIIKKAAALNKDKLAEFLREARLLRTYSHPNIVRFHGLSADEPVTLCMELADGGALNEYLKHNEVDASEKLRFCIEAARGLAYLHSKNVIHRDIAARNMLLVDGHVKIADFGLSTKVASQNEKFSEKDMTRSLPVRWMAPETCRGEYTVKSDVYAFGVLLWEIWMDGKIPWKEKAVQDIFNGVMNNKLTLERPEPMPEDVGTIMVEGCLAREPQKRWPMEKVCKALEELRRTESKETNSTDRSRKPKNKSKSRSSPKSKKDKDKGKRTSTRSATTDKKTSSKGSSTK